MYYNCSLYNKVCILYVYPELGNYITCTWTFTDNRWCLMITLTVLQCAHRAASYKEQLTMNSENKQHIAHCLTKPNDN